MVSSVLVHAAAISPNAKISAPSSSGRDGLFLVIIASQESDGHAVAGCQHGHSQTNHTGVSSGGGADLHRGQPGCLQARRRSEAPTRRLFNAGVPSETADLSRRGQAGQRQLCYGSRMLVAPPDPLHVRPINGIIMPRTAGCI